MAPLRGSEVRGVLLNTSVRQAHSLQWQHDRGIARSAEGHAYRAGRRPSGILNSATTDDGAARTPYHDRVDRRDRGALDDEFGFSGRDARGPSIMLTGTLRITSK